MLNNSHLDRRRSFEQPLESNNHFRRGTISSSVDSHRRRLCSFIYSIDRCLRRFSLATSGNVDELNVSGYVADSLQWIHWNKFGSFHFVD
jgi:hypothetical protein